MIPPEKIFSVFFHTENTLKIKEKCYDPLSRSLCRYSHPVY